MLRNLHIVILWMLLGFVHCDIWSVQPQPFLNLPALTGRWWTYRWLPNPGFNSTNLEVSYVWNTVFNPMTGTLDVNVQGRLLREPDTCSPKEAVIYPSRRPGIFNYQANAGIGEMEMFFARTDYITYFALIGCSPRFEKDCELTAAVRTRMPFAEPKLRYYLDLLIEKELCLNLNDMVDIQSLSRPFPECPAVLPQPHLSRQ